MRSLNALSELATVDLTQLDQAQLHDRVESKVLLHETDIPAALGLLASDYFVLDHDGERSQRYRTEYFDSPLLASYHDHHNQKANRFKARYRTYLNSDLTYFEVKHSVAGRTVKVRRRTEAPQGRLWPEDILFFYQQTGRDAEGLLPSLTVEYERVLLVRGDYSERVTIDVDIRYFSERRATQHSGLAVCEFKQETLDRRSPAIVALHRRPQKFSKYCMGLASCHPLLRRNRFKQVFRRLDALDVSVENLIVPTNMPELTQ